jgi:class 3 adenylate cyclase
MNTASRMESNGTAGKIHVSEATAEELIHQGKSHWLTPRHDKVMAKGKGELQTYWVSVRDKMTTKISMATTSVRGSWNDDYSKNFGVAAGPPSSAHSDKS